MGRGELGGREDDGRVGCIQLGGSAGYAGGFGFFGLRGGSSVLCAGLLSVFFDMRMGDGVGGKKNWSVMSRRTKSSEMWCDIGVRSNDERGAKDSAGRGLASSSMLMMGVFSSFSISSSDKFTMDSFSSSTGSVACTTSSSSSSSSRDRVRRCTLRVRATRALGMVGGVDNAWENDIPEFGFIWRSVTPTTPSTLDLVSTVPSNNSSWILQELH